MRMLRCQSEVEVLLLLLLRREDEFEVAEEIAF